MVSFDIEVLGQKDARQGPRCFFGAPSYLSTPSRPFTKYLHHEPNDETYGTILRTIEAYLYKIKERTKIRCETKLREEKP